MHIQKKALLGHILEYKHSLKNKGNLEAYMYIPRLGNNVHHDQPVYFCRLPPSNDNPDY